VAHAQEEGQTFSKENQEGSEEEGREKKGQGAQAIISTVYDARTGGRSARLCTTSGHVSTSGNHAGSGSTRVAGTSNVLGTIEPAAVGQPVGFLVQLD